jgi:uncharacterized membrane protein
VVGFLLVLLVGVMVNAYVVRYLLRIGEAFLARIPIVKTIFGAFKDITQFLPAGGKARDLKRVVLWRFGAAQLIGFVTEENVHARLFGAERGRARGRVLPDELPDWRLIRSICLAAELTETDLSVQEAMRLVLIGGVTSHPPSRQ